MLAGTRLFVPQLTLPIIAAWGDGHVDAPTQPAAEPDRGGSRIQDIPGEATWLDPEDIESKHCDVLLDRNAYVTGTTLVAIDRFERSAFNAVTGVFTSSYGFTIAPRSPKDFEP